MTDSPTLEVIKKLRHKTSQPPRSPTTQITMVAIIVLTIVGVIGGTILLAIKEDTGQATRVFGFTGAIVASLLALRKSEVTHLSVNSRMDDWAEALETVARGEGRAEGVEAGKAEKSPTVVTPEGAGLELTEGVVMVKKPEPDA